MVNVLPQAVKKRLTRMYWVRLIIAVLLLLASAWYIASAFLVPYVIFQKLSLQRMQETIEELEAQIDKKQYKEVLSIAHATTKHIARLEKIEDPNIMRDLQHIIETQREVAGISLTQIAYQRKGETVTITINGTATERDALIAFQRKLQQTQLYENISFPLSSLAAQETIPFVLYLKRTIQAYEK